MPDAQTIINAAEIINSMLLLRAYIDEDLKFTSVHWKDLLDVENLDISDTLFNNDKNTINLIHSLLGAVDRSRIQQKLANRIILSKDSEIARLKERLDQASVKMEKVQTKLNETININQSHLQSTIAELTEDNKSRLAEITKLKNLTNTLKTKYEVDIKAKNLEISGYKNKLLDKTLLPSSSLAVYSQHELNANIIYNNNPIIDNSKETSPNVGGELNKEYEIVISNLKQTIESLVTENYKYSRFVEMVNAYQDRVNSYLRLKTELTNPSEVMDIDVFSNIDKATIGTYFNELELFEVTIQPLLNNVFKLYENLIQLASSSDTSRVEQLTKELDVVKRNWKDALAVVDEWKAAANPTKR